jgi:bifunctional ADP-heptose synthase (sugar kinase/adenylyltransferase)
MNILVIGDSCRDIFVYGSINRMSPEAPVPVIVPAYQKENAGMAGNVAANLESLGANVTLVTNKQQIKKIRFVDERYNHMVLRVDEGDRCERIDNTSLDYSNYDAVIISDYCKGFLTEEDIQYISRNCACPTFLDTKKSLGDWCSAIKYIKINNFEYERNLQNIQNKPFLKEKIITTQGKRGCVFKREVFPTQEVPVKDVSGAGDTFISGLVVEYIRTKDIRKSIEFAQQCTTKVVQKTGVAII